MSFYFGSHIDISRGLIPETKNLIKAGGNLVQIYLTRPGFIKTNPDSLNELLQFNKFAHKNNIRIIVHCAYTHNIAKPWDKYSPWINTILDEIHFAHLCGAFAVVLHFGKQLNLSISQAYNNMFTSLVYINKLSQSYNNVKILLETPAGQGSELCSSLPDLAHFYNKIKKNKILHSRIKLCIDTCHLFAAGYCFDNLPSFFSSFDSLIGLDNIFLVHLNDSKVSCGSKKDRHANIGNGFIGFNKLKSIFDFFKNKHISIVLETPNYGYLHEIKQLYK